MTESAKADIDYLEESMSVGSVKLELGSKLGEKKDLDGGAWS